ncbi:Citrate synthase-like small alpha subdomain-containing protein [Dioscorea alata]|uniref:Citrate synthase-like small alpha subdomain-containing protein n=1 Tax=Dioscorea alata TaxID=55571 RepID=A0ACB7VJU1_DIOAL|nr:Citrate synthase-like small alpha subdomain-containing protein [Dioscorea alata]
MVCLRFTNLLLVLFLSLLALGHEIHATNEEMVKRMGRKLGAGKKEMEQVRNKINTAKSSSEKLFGSSTSNTIAKDKRVSDQSQVSSEVSKATSTNDNETPKRAPLGPDFETMDTKKLLQATREIFNMLNRDYQSKAHRRPPINN